MTGFLPAIDKKQFFLLLKNILRQNLKILDSDENVKVSIDFTIDLKVGFTLTIT